MGMKIAKPTNDILDSVRAFMNVCEFVLERDKWSMSAPEDRYLDGDVDDNDDDVRAMLAIRKDLAEELYCEENEVDNRIVCFEYLKRKYTGREKHVLLTAEVLIDNVCDPQKSHLDYSPYLEVVHVDGDL